MIKKIDVKKLMKKFKRFKKKGMISVNYIQKEIYEQNKMKKEKYQTINYKII